MAGLSISDQIIIYLVSAAVFTATDLVWLVKIAPGLYKSTIGHLMAPRPNLKAAGLFYSLYIIGLQVFVLVPALDGLSLGHAIGYGAMFGFITYATFDLTSQAVLKNWPAKISAIDMAWGTVLCSVVSAISFEIIKATLI